MVLGCGQYPDLYADKSNPDADAFNAVQRGHQNTLEVMGGCGGWTQILMQRCHPRCRGEGGCGETFEGVVSRLVCSGFRCGAES